MSINGTIMPNHLNVQSGTYAGIYGGNQVIFPVQDGVKSPLLQYQIVFDGAGVRGMYDVVVVVTKETITIQDWNK